MKKFFSTVVALCMLVCSMLPAFAENTVYTTPFGDIQVNYVQRGASGIYDFYAVIPDSVVAGTPSLSNMKAQSDHWTITSSDNGYYELDF